VSIMLITPKAPAPAYLSVNIDGSSSVSNTEGVDGEQSRITVVFF
jgi:hypothetical protein